MGIPPFPLQESVRRNATLRAWRGDGRPSSQGADHLTVSWKVTDDPPIIAHIDVKEENKENDFSLGQSLWIGDEAFEDLDEIIARWEERAAIVIN